MRDVQYVVFILHGQAYGIEISKIMEVLSYRQTTPLPGGRALSKGIISLRGVIVPVFDLREKFNIAACSYTRFHVIIVVEVDGRTMGIIADEISDIISFTHEEIQSMSTLPEGLRTDYLKGIAKSGADLIILLNIDKLLSVDEIELLDETAAL